MLNELCVDKSDHRSLRKEVKKMLNYSHEKIWSLQLEHMVTIRLCDPAGSANNPVLRYIPVFDLFYKNVYNAETWEIMVVQEAMKHYLKNQLITI